MEKIDKIFEYVKPIKGFISYEVAILATIDKVDEIVNWINQHKKIGEKDRDWKIVKIICLTIIICCFFGCIAWILTK